MKTTAEQQAMRQRVEVQAARVHLKHALVKLQKATWQSDAKTTAKERVIEGMLWLDQWEQELTNFINTERTP